MVWLSMAALFTLVLVGIPVSHAQVTRASQGACETTKTELHLCDDTADDFACFSTGATTTAFSTFASVETAGEGFGMEQFNESDTSLWQDMNATIANAADGSTAIQGCGEPLANAYTGKLVFVERGNCTFFDKLHNAALGGARAVVVFDTASASSTALNSNFRLPTGAIAPPVAEQQAVQGVPIFGVSFRTWSIIHPSVATAAAGESFSGASSPGPRYFTLKCAAALDLSDNTAVSNQWTQLASTSVFDSYDPIIFNVSACPDAIVADRDCIQTRAGCTAGFYCPYGNLPLEVTSPDIYAEIACNTSDLDYDETNCCLTNLTTGFVECKCPLGFYCPINTSQPLYCFEGFECREPATIRTCPVGTFCPYATVKAFECLFFDTCEEGSTKPDRWRLILFVFIVFVILQILLAARASYMKEYEHRADQHLEDYHRDREKRMERMNQAVHTMHRNNEISDAEKKKYLDYHARQSAHHIDNENVLRKNLGIHTVQEEAEIHAELRKSAVVIVVDNNGVPIGKRHRSGIQGPVAMDTDIPVTDLDDDAESDDGVEMKTAHRPSTLGEIVQRTVTVGFDEGNNLIHGGVAEESLTLLDSPIDGGAEIAYDIEFENIGMTLPTGQTIMEGVSGKFMSGTLTAIMGPSGAGKTTILSLVTGRSKKTHGSITVNGNVVSGLAKWKREVAFVPQDDVMHTDLTVRENIMFNARLRLPREWTEDEIREHVDWILDTLEIDHIQHTVVGDTRKRGVSGGQRKRVNIGMELAAFPSIVFLDEPTSGLDSTTATELVQLLKKLAQAHHLTIAAVIHAPTPRAFEQFDMLLLLQKGGRTAYFGEVGAGEIGPPAECFARLGYRAKHADEAAADYVLEVASGKVFREQSSKELDEGDGEELTAADVFKAYMTFTTNHGFGSAWDRGDINAVEDGHRAHRKHLGIAGVASHYEHALSSATHSAYISTRLWLGGVCNALKDEISAVFVHSVYPTEETTAPRNTPGVLVQFGLCVRRAWAQKFANPGAFLLNLVRHFVHGLALSISLSYTEGYIGPFPYVFCRYGSAPALFLQCTHPFIETVAVSGMLLVFTITFISVGEGIAAFIDEKVVYWREVRSGLTTTAYFLGKAAVEMVVLWLSASMFVAGYALNFANTGSWYELYAIILLMYLFGWVQGFLLSVICTKDSAALSSVVVSTMWCVLLGGFQPRLPQVNEEYAGFEWLWELSGPRWNLEAFFINQMEYYRVSPYDSSQSYINQTTTFGIYDFDRSNLGPALRNVFLITLGWVLVSIAVMTVADRDHKK